MKWLFIRACFCPLFNIKLSCICQEKHENECSWVLKNPCGKRIIARIKNEWELNECGLNTKMSDWYEISVLRWLHHVREHEWRSSCKINTILERRVYELKRRHRKPDLERVHEGNKCKKAWRGMMKCVGVIRFTKNYKQCPPDCPSN